MNFRNVCVPSILCTLMTAALTGCGSLATSTPAAPSQTSIGKISGSTYGGRQPIVGAQVYLFSAGRSGDAGYNASGLIDPSTNNASTSLLTAGPGVTLDTTTTDATYNDYYVTTDGNGGFSLTGDYTCTSGTQVYIYAIGGNPGAGINTAASLMAVLGNCPASGSLALQTPQVFVSEVSTVAAAYALAGFATDAVHVGSAGSTLSKIGMLNAFANAANLYNIGTPPTGTLQSNSGALAVTPGSGTNGGTGTVPQSEINSLANILAACVNSVGSSSAACSGLFANAKSAGSSGTAPIETATAAINIAHNPASNVTALYNLVGTTAVPYTPALAAPPANWTVSLAFSGAGLTATTGQPHGLALDSTGNVWVAAANGAVLSEFNPLGVPFNTAGFSTGLNLSAPQSVSLDANSLLVWIANSTNNSITSFTIATSAANNYALASTAGPSDVVTNGQGTMYVSNFADSTLSALTTSGVAIGQATSGNGLGGPKSLAIAAGNTGNIWVANSTTPDASAFTYGSTGSGIFADDTASASGNGTAIDAVGNIWVANNANTVTKLNNGGSFSNVYAAGTSGHLSGVSIDGAGNAWVTDLNGTAVFELSNGGTNLSGSSGYASSPSTKPDGIAVDSSGNIWYTSATNGSLRELIGAGVPVITPIAFGVANTLLGTRP